MPFFECENVKMHYIAQGDPKKPVILWAHGWGQSHAAWAQMIAPFRDRFYHIAVDFPGFGQSDFPPSDWGVPEYTAHMAAFLESITAAPVIWVGHSFGCRVGLRLAATTPELIKGLFLIGGAGLRRNRTIFEKISLYTKIYTFKACKWGAKIFRMDENWLKSKFGAPDYRNAPPAFRPVMMRVNADDLTHIVPHIQCPVGLVYGVHDKQTPPEIGYRLEKLIPNAVMHELSAQDHYTVLASGRHPVLAILKDFILGLDHK
jgi:pimeloyl-ACP methyl ester carboxylesterase